jgi:hypothetical protein
MQLPHTARPSVLTAQEKKKHDENNLSINPQETAISLSVCACLSLTLSRSLGRSRSAPMSGETPLPHCPHCPDSLTLTTTSFPTQKYIICMYLGISPLSPKFSPAQGTSLCIHTYIRRDIHRYLGTGGTLQLVVCTYLCTYGKKR